MRLCFLSIMPPIKAKGTNHKTKCLEREKRKGRESKREGGYKYSVIPRFVGNLIIKNNKSELLKPKQNWRTKIRMSKTRLGIYDSQM